MDDHDDLCPANFDIGSCQCKYIARIREDERKRVTSRKPTKNATIAESLERIHWDGSVESCNCNHCHGGAMTAREVVEFVSNELAKQSVA